VLYLEKHQREVIILTTKTYSELIPNRIFIGGLDAIDDLLKTEKIDVIYDLRAEVQGPLASEISIHQPITNEESEQEQSIKDATQKVIDSYNDGENIYFHCNTGRGRGGTIATSTLIALGLANSVDDAEQMAMEINPDINVRPQFKKHLKNIYKNQSE